MDRISRSHFFFLGFFMYNTCRPWSGNSCRIQMASMGLMPSDSIYAWTINLVHFRVDVGATNDYQSYLYIYSSGA